MARSEGSKTVLVQDEMPGNVNVYTLYTLEDTVACRFGPPFTSISDRTAARTAHQMIRETPDPRDFNLWRIGSFDILTGVMVVDTDPEQIILFSNKEMKSEVSNA